MLFLSVLDGVFSSDMENGALYKSAGFFLPMAVF